MIQHDHWCAIYRGGACSCVPNISIHGGGDVIVIDEEGRTKTSRTS
jgi:hypothetical protein